MGAAEVLEAVVQVIAEAYPGVRIYMEAIPQGFRRPCFFLHVEEQEYPLMNERAERCILLTVQRYPSKEEDAQALGLEFGTWFHLALGKTIVIAGKPRRAIRSKFNTVEEGVLVWESQYRQHVLKTEQQTKMGSLKHKEIIKSHG